MSQVFSNYFETRLNEELNVSATEVAVQSIVNIPTLGVDEYCYLTIFNTTTREIVKVTAIDIPSLTITIERGKDSTTAITWPTGSKIAFMVCKIMLDEILASVSDVPEGDKIAVYQDQKSSGTFGGTSEAGTQTRTLNTEVSDPNNIATLSSNAITPIEGTYLVIAKSRSYRGNGNRLYLHDGTSNVLEGVNGFSSNNYNLDSDAYLCGEITADGVKSYTLEHEISNGKATDGLGLTVSDGNSEVYTQLTLIKKG